MSAKRKSPATGLPAEKSFLDPRTFPDAYGLAVVGNCMAPAYPDGCTVRIAKSEPYGHNDVVVVWWRPDLVAAGRAPCMIKRIVMVAPPWVKSYPYKDNPKSDVRAMIMLGRDDRPDEMIPVRCADIIAIHKCVGPLADGEWHDARREGR